MNADKPAEQPPVDEQADWLPEESKTVAKKRQVPDYQQVQSTCSACE